MSRLYCSTLLHCQNLQYPIVCVRGILLAGLRPETFSHNLFQSIYLSIYYHAKPIYFLKQVQIVPFYFGQILRSLFDSNYYITLWPET